MAWLSGDILHLSCAGQAARSRHISSRIGDFLTTVVVVDRWQYASYVSHTSLGDGVDASCFEALRFGLDDLVGFLGLHV